MLKSPGKLYTIFILIFILFLPTMASALPAEDIEVINDREYFPRVHQLLKNAKRSIYVIMFSANYYDKYPDSESNILLKDLVEAKKRGLDVKVILDQEKPESGGLKRGKENGPAQNKRVAQFLKYHNVPYIMDSPDICTHVKLIIIDEAYTIIGSTNWSYSALEKNHETAVVIKSPQISKSYIKYFNSIW